jgi:hypothetical protein
MHPYPEKREDDTTARIATKMTPPKQPICMMQNVGLAAPDTSSPSAIYGNNYESYHSARLSCGGADADERRAAAWDEGKKREDAMRGNTVCQ